MGFLTRCKRPFLFAFLLHFCNMLFSFFLKTFLILFEKQQRSALESHAAFHETLVARAAARLSEAEIAALSTALASLHAFFAEL